MDAINFDPDAIARALGIAIPRQVAGSLPTAASTAFAPHRFRLGAFDCLIVNDGAYTVPAAFLAGNAPPRALAQALDRPLGAAGGHTTTMNILLVDTGKQLVLIDAGFGVFSPLTGRLIPSLRSLGVFPADIDAVVITHAHGDHIVGLLDAAGKLAFPNARHLINRIEWDFWLSDPDLAELTLDEPMKRVFRDSAKAILTRVRHRVDLFDDGEEILPGFTAVSAPGHTPGHTAVEIVSEGAVLLHVVDAAVIPNLHLSHPDWFLRPDNWPAHALLTRRRLLDRAASEDLLVQAFHFPFPGLGRVVGDGDNWTWHPTTGTA